MAQIPIDPIAHLYRRAGFGPSWAELQAGRQRGYGATLERGKANLSHVLEHLANGSGTAADRARAIALAREAALADDAGKALDRQLIELGAPARPVRPQPIVWATSRVRETERLERSSG